MQITDTCMFQQLDRALCDGIPHDHSVDSDLGWFTNTDDIGIEILEGGVRERDEPVYITDVRSPSPHRVQSLRLDSEPRFQRCRPHPWKT